MGNLTDLFLSNRDRLHSPMGTAAGILTLL